MKILVPEDQLRQGIQRMASEIRQHYAGKPLTLVGVLTGSICLLADLIRLLDIPLRVELIQAYEPAHGGTRPGPLAIDLEQLSDGVERRDVLLVDDIFDTGNTLWELIPQIDELNPVSVRSAVLLRKQGRAQVKLKPDFVGFDIPDVFVVGYGLDYRDSFRHLPYVAMLEPGEMRQELKP